MAIKSIPVTLHLYDDPLTGATVILPTDEEIDTDRARIEETEAEADVLLKGTKEEKITANARLQLCKNMTAAIDRQVKLRDSLKAKAEKKTFVLLKPTYGEYLICEAEAKTLDKMSGDITLDQSVLQTKLLRGAGDDPKISGIEGLTKAEVDDLEPNVARLLGAKLIAAVFPSQDLLPFSLRS